MGVEAPVADQTISHGRGGPIPAREYPFADFSLCLPTDFAAPGNANPLGAHRAMDAARRSEQATLP